MDVWISGAGGFLGKKLISELLCEGGFRICAMSSQPEVLEEAFSGAENLRVLPPDELFGKSGISLENAVLVNCAYPRNSGGSEIASGLQYIAELLEEAAEKEVRGIVNISSQSVYSPAREESADEKAEVSVESVYAAGKYCQELMTAMAAGGRPYTSVRLASLIGPGFDQRITNKLVRAAFEKRELRVKKNRQFFGFLDVEDAARGIAGLLKTEPERWRKVYNLGGDRGYTLTEMAECIRDVFLEEYGTEIRIICEEDDRSSCTLIDSELIRRDTGFAPRVPLEESIRRIAEYMEQEQRER